MKADLQPVGFKTRKWAGSSCSSHWSMSAIGIGYRGVQHRRVLTALPRSLVSQRPWHEKLSSGKSTCRTGAQQTAFSIDLLPSGCESTKTSLLSGRGCRLLRVGANAFMSTFVSTTSPLPSRYHTAGLLMRPPEIVVQTSGISATRRVLLRGGFVRQLGVTQPNAVYRTTWSCLERRVARASSASTWCRWRTLSPSAGAPWYCSRLSAQPAALHSPFRSCVVRSTRYDKTTCGNPIGRSSFAQKDGSLGSHGVRDGVISDLRGRETSTLNKIEAGKELAALAEEIAAHDIRYYQVRPGKQLFS